MLAMKIGAGDFDEATAGLESDVAGFTTAAMRDTTGQVRDAFRAQVRAAGLGDRLANAVRGVTYPKDRNALEPTGWVYAQPSKKGRGAAAIVESYASGAYITARNGKRWLAVPTDDCPRKRGGEASTPAEVEKRFGRPLQFIRPNDHSSQAPGMRQAGVAYLAITGLALHKPSGKWRKAGARARSSQTVVMFTLVPGVKKPQTVDLSEPERLAQARFPANLDKHWK